MMKGFRMFQPSRIPSFASSQLYKAQTHQTQASQAQSSPTRAAQAQPSDGCYLSDITQLPTGQPSGTLNDDMRSANEQEFTKEIQQLDKACAFVPRADNIVVAISSGALFDFSEDHDIRETQGVAAHNAFQLANKTKVLNKGDGFALVEKLYMINQKLADAGIPARFDVIITSKNKPTAGMRASHSINHYKLPIARKSFTSGASPFGYAKNHNASLYLTTNPSDAKQAIEANVPAVHILPSQQNAQDPDKLRVAFDADAVIFSDASERISMTQGLEAFCRHEKNNVDTPLEKGPLYPLLESLSKLKSAFIEAGVAEEDIPIRIAIVTARSAPSDERLQGTLLDWGIDVDELHVLGGVHKGPFLEEFKADLFLDDKYSNAENGSKHVVSGHVHYGVSNEPKP